MATIPQPPPCLSHSSPLTNPIAAFSSSRPISLFPKSKSSFIKPALNSSNNTDAAASSEPPKPVTLDPVKLAFERAKAYKKSIKTTSPSPVPSSVESPGPKLESGSSPGDYLSVKMALERAGVSDRADNDAARATSTQNLFSGNSVVEKKASKKEESTISSIDFMGLNFADKKKGRGLPAGLMPVVDPVDVPDSMEVEFIAGDMSNFRESTVSDTKAEEEDDSDVYKPKVSTWGVFPRPGNISKTYGGGRTIRPGEVLETEEDKVARNAKTRQQIAAYKARVGMNIDPKLKAECQKALNDGDDLMDRGKLKEALPFYEDIMKKLTFKSELHGLAALQWSICVDSLSRPDEARIMYEKLQSHRTVRVSKAARDFMFSFQAMEMMKVRSARTPSRNTGFQNYFEAFLENKPNYALKESETSESTGEQEQQALPYILFLASPLLIILIVALRKVV